LPLAPTPSALDEERLTAWTRAWHRLDPWPDAVEGLTQLQTQFPLVTLSNGNVALLIALARRAGLRWDAILGAERLSQLIYLDGFAPREGESLNDLLGPGVAAYFAERARAGRRMAGAARPPRRGPTHRFPAQGRAAAPVAAPLPRTYVLHTAKDPGDPLGPILAGMAERARAAGWRYRELATGHWPPLDHPHEVAHLLIDLA
jgi:hypothetical protein